ncbi:MAG: BatA domain-containing protein [Bacteroidota bacterium]
MTFLNPLALIGFIAAAIPLLLHLFNLRKIRRIEFSTLTFLKELQRTTIRRIKVKQWLLLLIRTALVVALVLAFARPALRGTLGVGGGSARTSIAIILDNSLSMGARDSRGEFLKQAKEEAFRILGLMHEGDDGIILRTSDLASAGKMELTHNFDILHAAVEQTNLSYTRASIDDAVRVAAKLLETSQSVNKEIYVISDMQRASLGLRSSEFNRGESIPLLPSSSSIFFVKIGNEIPANASVDSVSIANQIFQLNRPFFVQAQVRNESPSPLRNEVVGIFLNGTRVAQRGLDIPSHQARSIEVPVVPQSPGFQVGRVAIEGDGIEGDNERFFCVAIPKECRVLIVHHIADDLGFVKLALRVAALEDSSAIIMSEIPESRFASVNLSDVQVVIASWISRGMLPSVKRFLERGGGLVLFPSEGFDMQQFNEISAELGLPRAVGTKLSAGKVQPSSMRKELRSSGALTFSRVDFAHPLFTGVFEERSTLTNKAARRFQRQIESPTILQAVEFSPGPSAISVIEMTGRLPFLVDQPVGKGRVLLFAVAPNLQWSDFPLKPIFVPLVYRSAVYASSTQQAIEQTLVGAATDIRLTGSAATAVRTGSVAIRGANGIQIYAKSTLLPDGDVLMHIEGLPVPGVYLLGSDAPSRIQSLPVGKALAALVVNIDPAEADPARLDEAGITSLLSRMGISAKRVHFLTVETNLFDVVQRSRYGVELWSYFAVFSLLLALVELFVAQSQSGKHLGGL